MYKSTSQKTTREESRMTNDVRTTLEGQRTLTELRISAEYKLMASRGSDKYTKEVIKCRYYLDELETAATILESTFETREVSLKLIEHLNKANPSELEAMFDGLFVKIYRVRKTGVVFVAFNPKAKS